MPLTLLNYTTQNETGPLATGGVRNIHVTASLVDFGWTLTDDVGQYYILVTKSSTQGVFSIDQYSVYSSSPDTTLISLTVPMQTGTSRHYQAVLYTYTSLSLRNQDLADLLSESIPVNQPPPNATSTLTTEWVFTVPVQFVKYSVLDINTVINTLELEYTLFIRTGTNTATVFDSLGVASTLETFTGTDHTLTTLVPIPYTTSTVTTVIGSISTVTVINTIFTGTAMVNYIETVAPVAALTQLAENDRTKADLLVTVGQFNLSS